MAIRIPRIIHSKRILRKFSTTTDHRDSMTSNVPKGYLAVYVGEQEKMRFVVPVSIVNLPSFQDLLIRAEQEFGFDHPMGGLTIPCSEELFLDLIPQLKGL